MRSSKEEEASADGGGVLRPRPTRPDRQRRLGSPVTSPAAAHSRRGTTAPPTEPRRAQVYAVEGSDQQASSGHQEVLGAAAQPAQPKMREIGRARSRLTSDDV